MSVRNNDRSTGHIGSVYRTDINRTNILTNTNITNFIRGLAESGSDMNDIVDKIASKYTIQELNEAIKDNDNPYLCKKALEIKDQEGVKYVSKDVINKAVDDVRKKTNYFYRDKVYKNKREHGRISATKSFLSRSNKKK